MANKNETAGADDGFGGDVGDVPKRRGRPPLPKRRGRPLLPKGTEPSVVHMPEPGPMPKAVAPDDEVLHGVKKGDRVRLLVPHYDGYQLLPADSVVQWWNDDPPSARNAERPEVDKTPLTAPSMTDGKPPDSYRDPKTGKKPVIGSA